VGNTDFGDLVSHFDGFVVVLATDLAIVPVQRDRWNYRYMSTEPDIGDFLDGESHWT
jgi:hypothetical protein